MRSVPQSWPGPRESRSSTVGDPGPAPAAGAALASQETGTKHKRSNRYSDTLSARTEPWMRRSAALARSVRTHPGGHGQGRIRLVSTFSIANRHGLPGRGNDWRRRDDQVGPLVGRGEAILALCSWRWPIPTAPGWPGHHHVNDLRPWGAWPLPWWTLVTGPRETILRVLEWHAPGIGLYDVPVLGGPLTVTYWPPGLIGLLALPGRFPLCPRATRRVSVPVADARLLPGGQSAPTSLFFPSRSPPR